MAARGARGGPMTRADQRWLALRKWLKECRDGSLVNAQQHEDRGDLVGRSVWLREELTYRHVLTKMSRLSRRRSRPAGRPR